jgi:hypothetical protein
VKEHPKDRDRLKCPMQEYVCIPKEKRIWCSQESIANDRVVGEIRRLLERFGG